MSTPLRLSLEPVGPTIEVPPRMPRTFPTLSATCRLCCRLTPSSGAMNHWPDARPFGWVAPPICSSNPAPTMLWRARWKLPTCAASPCSCWAVVPTFWSATEVFGESSCL